MERQQPRRRRITEPRFQLPDYPPRSDEAGWDFHARAEPVVQDDGRRGRSRRQPRFTATLVASGRGAMEMRLAGGGEIRMELPEEIRLALPEEVRRDLVETIRRDLLEVVRAQLLAIVQARLREDTTLLSPSVGGPVPSAVPDSPEDDAVRERLVDVLREARGDLAAAARILGTARSQIRAWCQQFDIDVASFRRRAFPVKRRATAVKSTGPRPRTRQDSDRDRVGRPITPPPFDPASAEPRQELLLLTCCDPPSPPDDGSEAGEPGPPIATSVLPPVDRLDDLAK